MPNLRFEQLREEWIPTIAAVEKTVHSAPWSEQGFRNEITNPHSIFRVAFLGDNIVGYGGVWTVVDEAHVTNVVVHPDFRRQRIGHHLMVELLRESQARGMTCSTLEVRVSNDAAIALYENLGYAPTAIRKGYYPDNREDALIMWLYRLQEWKSP